MTYMILITSFLLFLAVLCALVIRDTETDIWFKVLLPIALFVVAIIIPFKSAEILGYPTTDSYPDCSRLISVVGTDSKAYLWVEVGKEPRAFVVNLSNADKEELTKAAQLLNDGKKVRLGKDCSNGSSGHTNGHGRGRGQGGGGGEGGGVAVEEDAPPPKDSN